MQITPAILTDYLQASLDGIVLAGNAKLRFRGVRLFVAGEEAQPDLLYLLPEEEAALAVEQGFSAIVPVAGVQQVLHTPPRNSCILYAQCQQGRLFNLVSECFLRYDEWFQDIYQAIAAGESMEEILEKCYPMLKNPFFIDDSSYRTLARLKDYPATDFKDDEYIFMQKSGHHSAEYIYAMLNSSVALESSAIAPKPIIHKFDFLAHRTLYSTIKVEGEIVGFFSCLELETEFTGGLIDVFESLTELMSLALGRESSVPISRQKGLNNDLYLGILNGSIRDPELTDTAFVQLGLARGAYYVVYITTNVATIVNPFLLPRIIELLSANLEKGSFAIADGANIILVVSGRPDEEAADKLVQLIRFYLREYEVTIGISMGFADPQQMPLFYDQALAATRLGPCAHEGHVVFRYGEVVEYDVLDKLGERQKREAICHPAAHLLYQHDREKHTGLLPTLKAYIRCLGDTLKAADMLFLHRNSLYYRLKQIVDLTGIDLHDGALLSHIMISISAIELDDRLGG